MAITTVSAANSSQNSSTNVSSGRDLSPAVVPALWYAVLTIVTLSLIIIATIVGNILVILSVFTYKPLRNVQNFLIVSLAVADLSVSILVMPLNVVTLVFEGRWQFGPILCDFWLTCDIFFCTASILNLCAIALDRYWAIRCPMSYANKRTLNMVLLMIFLVYALSGLISIPPLFGWKKVPDSRYACRLSDERGYVIFSAFGSFFIPAIIIGTVYLHIFLAVRKRLQQRKDRSALNKLSAQSTPLIKVNKQNHQNNHNHHNNPPNNASDECETPIDNNETQMQQPTVADKEDVNRLSVKLTKQGKKGKSKQAKSVSDDSSSEKEQFRSKSSGGKKQQRQNQDDENDDTISTISNTARETPKRPPASAGPTNHFFQEKQRILLSRETRATRTLGIIMGVFILSWVPFFSMYVIMPFCGAACIDHLDPNVEAFIVWLGYVNSALNPVIYTIFNMDFRRAFQKLLHLN